MLRSMIFRGCAGLLLAALPVSAAVTESGSVKQGTFSECSSHCGSEHEGERHDMKLCVELCRLFEFSEPATLVD